MDDKKSWFLDLEVWLYVRKVFDFVKLEYYKEVLDFHNIEYRITFLLTQILGQQCHTGDSPRNLSSLNSSTIKNLILWNLSTKKSDRLLNISETMLIYHKFYQNVIFGYFCQFFWYHLLCFFLGFWFIRIIKYLKLQFKTFEGQVTANRWDGLTIWWDFFCWIWPHNYCTHPDSNLLFIYLFLIKRTLAIF